MHGGTIKLLMHLLKTEPRFIGYPARSLTTTITTSHRLPHSRNNPHLIQKTQHAFPAC